MCVDRVYRYTHISKSVYMHTYIYLKAHIYLCILEQTCVWREIVVLNTSIQKHIHIPTLHTKRPLCGER